MAHSNPGHGRGRRGAAAPAAAAPVAAAAAPAAAASVSLVSDGNTTVFTVAGLAPNTSYQPSFEYVGADGQGCNTGMSAQPSDAAGAITFRLDPPQTVTCGNPNFPGTLHAWLSPGGSQDDVQIVTLSDGSRAEATITIS